MDESTIQHAINTAYAISGLTAVLLFINGIISIFLAVNMSRLSTTVKGLAECIKKLFDWFDNRPCDKHNERIIALKEE
jgi:hypothetical protein